jgi:hypothetical protein
VRALRARFDTLWRTVLEARGIPGERGKLWRVREELCGRYDLLEGPMRHAMSEGRRYGSARRPLHEQSMEMASRHARELRGTGHISLALPKHVLEIEGLERVGDVGSSLKEG